MDGGHGVSPGALLVAAERRGHLRRAVKDEASSGAVQQGELSHAAECPGEGGLGVRTVPPLGARAGRGLARGAHAPFILPNVEHSLKRCLKAIL